MYTPNGSDKLVYPDLGEEIADMALIMKGKSWVTDDPLGIGGLLCDAYRVGRMIEGESFVQTNSMQVPAEYRLAFRELGLSIGLRAVVRLNGLIQDNPDLFKESSTLNRCIEELLHYTGLIGVIENFWLGQTGSEVRSWVDHRDINMVMLMTSLAPDGFLTI
jgi:hypothetical protein